MKKIKNHYAERYVLHYNVLRAIGAGRISVAYGCVFVTPPSPGINRFWLLPPKGKRVTRKNHPWWDAGFRFGLTDKVPGVEHA